MTFFKNNLSNNEKYRPLYTSDERDLTFKKNRAGVLTLSSKNDSESNKQVSFRAMNCELGDKYI